MAYDFSGLLKKKPIIAALCEEKSLEDLCISNVKIAFILCGNMQTVPLITDKIRKAKIHPFIHIDFIDGLSSSGGAVDFVKYYTSAEGIVTTKASQIRHAHDLGLVAVQRFFVWDKISQDNVAHQLKQTQADGTEVLPGVIPSIIQTMSEKKKVPLIAGGFINTQKDIQTAISCGADAITTSVASMWFV